MRSTATVYPEIGDKRELIRFLWLPTTLFFNELDVDGRRVKQTRWLERAKIIEERVGRSNGRDVWGVWEAAYWVK